MSVLKWHLFWTGSQQSFLRWGDVGTYGEVEDEAGCGVLYGLESRQEVGVDSGVQGIVVV